MPSFKFTDGTPDAEFTTFEADPNHLVSITLPSASGKVNGWASVKIYVSPEDAADAVKLRRTGSSNVGGIKIRAGILAQATKHPFPKGLYIPYTLQGWGSIQHRIDNLTGSYIINEKVQQEK